MKQYKAIQIIKHALAYYIGREGAAEAKKILRADLKEDGYKNITMEAMRVTA